jgi:hypothetical protein
MLGGHWAAFEALMEGEGLMMEEEGLMAIKTRLAAEAGKEHEK